MAKISQTTDVVYDTALDLKLDVYYPEDQSLLGGIIDIHGGGWFRGDKAKDADWATRLANEGFLVVVPNYRITPAGYYPDPLTDMDHVYDWLQHSDYDFDKSKIAAVGSSAGGNMTVEMGIKFGIPIVSLSGIIDIEDWLQHHEAVVAKPDTSQDFNAASAQIDQTGANDSFYKWFVTNYFNGRTDQFKDATPYLHVTDQTGPMYLANSLNEFVPTSGVISLAETLNAHQIPSTSRFLTGSRHAKGYLDDVYDETVAFLKRNLA